MKISLPWAGQKKKVMLQVDESLLSASSDVELCGVGGGQALQPLQQAQPPSYPWVQMALPGGGIVSVPLERDCSPDSSAAAAASAGPSSSLTVSAGEPVTHFNLDQLLEIVQSFQLDTTLAAHEDGEAAKQLNMVLAAANAADASQVLTYISAGLGSVTLYKKKKKRMTLSLEDTPSLSSGAPS